MLETLPPREAQRSVRLSAPLPKTFVIIPSIAGYEVAPADTGRCVLKRAKRADAQFACDTLNEHVLHGHPLSQVIARLDLGLYGAAGLDLGDYELSDAEVDAFWEEQQ